MRKHIITALAGVVTLVGLTVVAETPATAAPVRPAIDCTQSPSQPNVKAPGFFTGNGVNIRTGPGTSCTAIGEGNEGDDVTVHCTEDNGTATWVYLTDHTANRTGWSKYPLAKWNGQMLACA